MLEAHAPHEAIQSWKGFFIHIAAIVIGLFIAVGLEQAVDNRGRRCYVPMTRVKATVLRYRVWHHTKRLRRTARSPC